MSEVVKDEKDLRNSGGYVAYYSLTTSPIEVAAPYRARYSITFGINGSNTALVSPDQNVASGVGFPLTNASGIYTFTLKDHGQKICGNWFASMGSGTGTLTVLDCGFTDGGPG